MTPPQKERYVKLRNEGFTRAAACREVGLSYQWAKGFDNNLRNDNGVNWRQARAEAKLRGPIPLEELTGNAKRGVEDFEFLRYHYLGRVSSPWQVETAYRVVEWLATPEKEFVVNNCPPGVGKTTLAHDIGAWVTVRDRRLRGLFGSRVETNARRQLLRLRRTLERTSPPKAPAQLVEKGLAVDAKGCLARDYGLFRPTTRDVWSADQFIVAQFDDEPIEEKEPTWSCYGMDSGVLGNRFNLIFWDDVVDKTTIRTLDAQQNQRDWWDDEAETRLEPDGVLFLIGQRMGATDLYRYCLDKTIEPDDEDDEESPERPRLYRHVVYKAHDESRCTGEHSKDLSAWPESCLLDPKRLPWKGRGGLRVIHATKKRTYQVQYQQEDVDPEDVLVRDVWIWGGIDPEDGTLAPGCIDESRGLCELPSGLVGPKYSIATVDPSVKKMWAIQWWIYTPEASEQHFLMDLERRAIPANELLDWSADRHEFYGIMDDWQLRSEEMGLKITHWIVETNAAHRYLLAYDHVRRWKATRGVSILPHTTGPRKLDQDYGPWIVRDHFKHGRVRLPGKQKTNARFTSLKLVDELLRWPNAGTTDDEVMACWFYFLHLPNLAVPSSSGKLLRRPHWLRKAS